jgi:mono/diheme cytochrome c family protein
MRFTPLILICLLIGNATLAQDDPATLAERGKALYFERVSCWVCHGDNAEGGVGPTLQHGPTPMDIQEQLDSNPQMGVIVAELDPDADDLVALAAYLGSLDGDPVSDTQISSWRTQLAAIEAAKEPETVFYVSDRDRKVMDIMSFDTVLEDWTRHAKTGGLKRDYDVKVLATYEPGEQMFSPEAGELYFYENVGTNARRRPAGTPAPASTSVVVGNARTKEVIASREMPGELRGAVHTTVLSPDGRYIYIIGPSGRSMGAPAMGGEGMGMGSVLRTPATLLKVDAPCCWRPFASCTDIPGQVPADGYVYQRPGRSRCFPVRS